MRLIELTANMPSFRTVKFNRTGPSFIVARQKDPESSVKNKTYNGVGKSLIVALVHFCLGSSRRPGLVSALPGWEFSLKFAIGDRIYTARRSTDPQDAIHLNDTKLTPAKLNGILGSLCFDIPENGKRLTWRMLLPAFIRSNDKAYFCFDVFGGTRTDEQKEIVNSFLLGLDTKPIINKLSLRNEQQRVKALTDNFKKDTVLKEFLAGTRDVSLSIRELTDQIDRLEKDLEKFEVAEDYYETKDQADHTQRRAQELSNKLVLLNAQVAAINKSLEFSPDLGREKIEQVYNEAKLHFPKSVKSRLSDVEQFHTQLANNREKRLSEQKSRILEEISTQKKESDKNKKMLDDLLQYLGAHRALDVFVSLSNRLAALRTQLENLRAYEKMQDEYRRRQRELKEIFLKENQRTEDYLKEIAPILEENREFFRSLSKRFYPDSPSGITVKLNEGENKIRYNLDARIESDSSGGINNVKIFCYDLTLLFRKHNHHINFLFHDSRIFNGVDERQKTAMIEAVGELFEDSGNQYIVTMNQNQLEEVRRHIAPDRFAAIIEKNTVLTLTDGSPEEKLLGIDVDLKYE